MIFSITAGRVIRGLRERRYRARAQGALALEATIAQSTLSRIERGVAAPDLHQLRDLASALALTVVELVALIEETYARITRALRHAGRTRDRARRYDPIYVRALAQVVALGVIERSGQRSRANTRRAAQRGQRAR